MTALDSQNLSPDQLDRLCIDSLRVLCADATHQAGQSLAGSSKFSASILYCLWKQFLKFDHNNPLWMNRDRFILSSSQTSVLFYSLLHLCEVKSVVDMDEVTSDVAISLEDLKQLKQLGGRLPLQPEYGLVSGIEATTGLSGQGIAMSVGMAIAQSWSAQYFNRPSFEIFDYRIYALCGTDDLMEGVASESGAIAGNLNLANLCWIYDCNNVEKNNDEEKATDFAISESIVARFQSYGWHVIQVDDAENLDSLTRAFETFQQVTDQPTLIVINSSLAEEDSAINATKQAYGWPKDREFWVPDSVREQFKVHVCQRGCQQQVDWASCFDSYQLEHPALATEIYQMQYRELPEQWDAKLPEFSANQAGVKGTAASAKVLNAIAQSVPWMLGGSADLQNTPNTRLTFEGAGNFAGTRTPAKSDLAGHNLYFGVREHAMAAILNGLSLSKIRPYGSTRLALSDYGQPAIRLSAIMKVPVIYIFTYSSGVQPEAGPVYQSIEQLISLRSIPELIVLRPADANEVVESWWIVMQLKHNPSVIVLSQQPMTTFDRNSYASAAGVHEGGYILADAPHANPDVLLLSTGSEVYLCLRAYEQLKAEGINSRVVSMPSWELFEKQSQAYRRSVLPPNITARVSVERASTIGWSEYTGLTGIHLGKDSFNRFSEDNFVDDRFTVDKIVESAKSQILN